MKDLKHKCLPGTARSKITILKRLREKKHPTTKNPLVGLHRIHLNCCSVAEEVSVSCNPGMSQVSSDGQGSPVGLIASCSLGVQDLPAGPLCLDVEWQDALAEHFVFEDCDADFDSCCDADFEAARGLGLLD